MSAVPIEKLQLVLFKTSHTHTHTHTGLLLRAPSQCQTPRQNLYCSLLSTANWKFRSAHSPLSCPLAHHQYPQGLFYRGDIQGFVLCLQAHLRSILQISLRYPSSSTSLLTTHRTPSFQCPCSDDPKAEARRWRVPRPAWTNSETLSQKPEGAAEVPSVHGTTPNSFWTTLDYSGLGPFWP